MPHFHDHDPYDFNGISQKIPGLTIGIDNEIDYRFTKNKPTINGRKVEGDRSLEDFGIASSERLGSHESDTDNPHSVTKEQVGLGNVDNTSDADKPVSNATRAELEKKYERPQSGIPKSDLSAFVRSSLEKADSALQSFEERDPTVPSWAKFPTKPSYDASEVGADPAGSASAVREELSTAISQKIPSSDKGVANGVATLGSDGRIPSSQLPEMKSALKDMESDSDHRTVSDAEKAEWNGKQPKIDDLDTIREGAGKGSSALQPNDISDWAKASVKPSYNASEVGALPADTHIPSDVTETTVSGWGFTKNAGTVTKVKVNGSEIAPSSGVVDVGTVLRSLPTIEKSDLSSSVQAELSSSAEKQSWSSKQDAISDLAAIRSGAALGATALQSFTESDPTVPSWAKQPDKPSYELSELSDDSSHRLVTDAEKTSWSAKYSKPSGGIPESDLSDSVKSSLSNADSALQQSAISDMATKTWVGQQGFGHSNIVLGETSSTAFAGDKGKTAYDHSQTTAGNPHGVTWDNLAGQKPTTVGGFGITDAQKTDNLVTTVDSSSTDEKYPSAKAVHDAIKNAKTEKVFSSDGSKYMNSDGELYSVGAEGAEDEKTDFLVKDSAFRTQVYQDESGDVCIEYDDSDADGNAYERPSTLVGSPLVVNVSPSAGETAVSFTAEPNIDYVFTAQTMASLSDVPSDGGGVSTPSVNVELPVPQNATKAYVVSVSFDGTSSSSAHSVSLSGADAVSFSDGIGIVPSGRISMMEAKWDGTRWIVAWANSKEVA